MPRAAAASESTVAEPPVAEAEGFRLHLSNNNGTGYRGVRKHSCGRFQAQHRAGERMVYLGTFDTEVEAAVAYARAVGEPTAVVAEAEGLRLHLSSNSTGYKGVFKHHDGRRFRLQRFVGGKAIGCGTFDTAVEAAVAYARDVGEAAGGAAASDSSATLNPDEVVTAIVCDGCEGDFELPPGTVAPEGVTPDDLGN